MSQTSFLESVVTWDENQCKENLQEALPRLIGQLANTSVSQEELGICRIVCQLFLPWVKIKDVERTVFMHITAKICGVMDKVLESISDLCRQTSVQNEIQVLMEMFIEILDCYSSCFKYVQSEGGNSPSMSDIHSLPYGAVHLLKGAYSHCKESGSIYGEFLPEMTDLLSALFKKAHGLQMAFLGVLEKISTDSQVTEDEVQDLCFICQGLFEICQTVTSLDAKLVCSLWKTISRFSSRHSNHLKNDLDVDSMIVFLCQEIQSGFIYLFQLAPPKLDSTELSLSQGDNAAFQKSLKVLSYQLRIMISLLDSFVDYVSACELNLFQLIICVYRNLPPCLDAPCVSDTHVAEIQRQILNGTEPLVNLLIRKQNFMECVTSDKTDLLTTEDQLPFLLLLVKILDRVPKQTDDVVDRWMSPKLYEGDKHRYGLLECFFKAVDNCYIEMSLSFPEEVTIIPDQKNPVSVYEYVCTHLCGLVGSIRANHFVTLEQCLMVNLLSQNVYVTTLVMDVWCFMARFGTADLCFKQTQTLLGLCARLQTADLCHPIYSLTRRLLKFLSPDHQIKLLKTFPLEQKQNLWLYKIMPVVIYQGSYRISLMETLTSVFIAAVQQFTNSVETTTGDIEYLSQSPADLLFIVCGLTLSLIRQWETLSSVLQCIYNCKPSADLCETNTLPHPGAALGEYIYQLLMMWQKEWLDIPLMGNCFAELLKVAGFCVKYLPDDIFIKIFDLMVDAVTVPCYQSIKMAAIQFLISCRKLRLPPNAQQPLVLKKIPRLFHKLLNDTDVLIHHSALDAFTQFAESTPHEEVVPECLENSEYLQDSVVSFLNKKPCVSSSTVQRDFMKKQRGAVHSNKTAINTSPDVANTKGNDVIRKQLGTEIDENCCNIGGGKANHHGDMLDDITYEGEPSLKRKRLLEDQPTGIIEIIEILETKLGDIEAFPRSSLTPQNVNKLRCIHTRLKTLLDS